NPPFGATFTYFLAEKLRSEKEERHKTEKALREKNADVPFPGWEQLHAEAEETAPQVLLLVRDEAGKAVRWLTGPVEAGVHRVSWDLRLAPVDPIDLSQPTTVEVWELPPHGPLAAPGTYSVTLYLQSAAGLAEVGAAQSFTVKPLSTIGLETDFNVTTTFQQRAGDLLRRVAGANVELSRAEERLKNIRAALVATPQADASLFTTVGTLVSQLAALARQLRGDEARANLDEAMTPSIRGRVQRLMAGHWQTRQPPTATQRDSLAQAEREFGEFQQAFVKWLNEALVPLEAHIETLGAPWTPGRQLPL
ncbi:MAG: hypothetical protein KDE58_18840, partial [Caldilineaceae bacterium]|nr:hypothetical protein [Caldilineaceae bacterium]